MSKELLTEPKNIFSVFLQCPKIFISGKIELFEEWRSVFEA